MLTTNDVRVEVYRSFMEDGRAPQTKEISVRLQLSVEEAAKALRELSDQDVIAFLPGTEDLWLAHPFCATRAPFNVSVENRRWDAICVWDALGILALVQADGEISTFCPDCGKPLHLRVSGGAVEAPARALVHYGVPARRWYEDVGYT